MAAWIVLPVLTFAQAEKPASSTSGDLATPRFPDGHPNLGSAPGQKGYWEVRPGLVECPEQRMCLSSRGQKRCINTGFQSAIYTRR